jgi:hypothetical protein
LGRVLISLPATSLPSHNHNQSNSSFVTHHGLSSFVLPSLFLLESGFPNRHWVTSFRNASARQLLSTSYFLFHFMVVIKMATLGW